VIIRILRTSVLFAPQWIVLLTVIVLIMCLVFIAANIYLKQNQCNVQKLLLVGAC
jgi:hypothetical protein